MSTKKAYCPACGHLRPIRWPVWKPKVCSKDCAAHQYLGLLSAGIDHHCEVCGEISCGRHD